MTLCPQQATRIVGEFTPQPAAIAAHEGNEHETGRTEKFAQESAAKKTDCDEEVHGGEEGKAGGSLVTPQSERPGQRF